jgi:fatty-acyl-CoA synthase
MRDLARKHGARPALVSERERMSYAELDARADRYACWALDSGIVKGDVVALMMPNRPEYLAAWLGIARAGGVTALLNTNLSGAALAHSIGIVAPKLAIVEDSLVADFRSAMPHLEHPPELWCHGGAPEGFRRLDTALAALPGTPPPEKALPRLTIEDKCLYVYTSGTTGLPKAANINHYRVQSIMFGFNGAMRVRRNDRIYVCLPMYHTSGGVLGPGAALTAGASAVLRERFSASAFWEDIVANDCTIFVYIGELCRYLLNSPPQPAETRHHIRLACGNGLRPDIWEAFQKRFRIGRIFEWYAATEGNCVFMNFDGKVGAVGRIPKWVERKFAVDIVRYDVEAGAPLRGPDGFCLRAAPGEIGEAISKIVNDPKQPSQRFEGYADNAATEAKILRDAFEKGDRWFRTGDLMRRDADGYYYFVDRIGDTFRWKGENVATSEVQEALTGFPGVKEANVYGVGVPGAEGRAGMAALVTGPDFDLAGVPRHVVARLAPYARPLFLRLTPETDQTSTFKQRKIGLARDGFDPDVTAPDRVYFLHPELQAYVPLDRAMYADICEGRIRI